MAIAYHTTHSSYIVYAEETAYGSGGTPAAGNRVGKVSNISINMSNNFFRTQGLGEGRNITGSFTGPFDISGSIDWDVDDFIFMQYAIGTLSGTGVVADPYQLDEADNIGYLATDIPSIRLEIGTEAGTTDDTTDITGVVINNLTLTATQGETLKASCDFIGQSAATGTSIVTYTTPTTEVFVFQQGAVTVGTDTLHCTSFALTIANNIQTFRQLGSRLIQQPVTGLRRYDFTITMRKKLDSTASILSPLELRDLFFGASAAPATAGTVSAYAVSLDITEGAVAGDRVCNIDLENCYFESWSEPIPLEGGFIEVTVTGFGQAGLTDGSDKVPIRWYTIA